MPGDQLLFRGGTTAENDAYTGGLNELIVDEERNQLRRHDTLTPGGHVIGTLFSGDTAENDGYTGFDGEVTFDTEAWRLRGHDGDTAGGHWLTGATVGSNAAGRFRRHPDGWLECWRTVDLGPANALGTGTDADPYRTANLNSANWPADFSEIPFVQATVISDAGTAASKGAVVSIRQISATQALHLQAISFSSTANTADVVVHLYAAGQGA